MSRPIVLSDVRERLERFIRECLDEYRQAECLCGFDANPDLPRRDIVCPKHDPSGSIGEPEGEGT